MGFQGPKTCSWLKIVTKFFFLGGGVQQNSKFEILAPKLECHLRKYNKIESRHVISNNVASWLV